MAIDRKSIGYIWVNGKQLGYNTHLLETNHIDFEKDLEPNKEQETKKKIYIRRK